MKKTISSDVGSGYAQGFEIQLCDALIAEYHLENVDSPWGKLLVALFM